MRTLIQDITFREEPDRLVLANRWVSVEVERGKGAWVSLTCDGVQGNLLSPAASGPTLDFRVDGQWMVEKRGASLRSYEVALAPDHSSVTLSLRYQVPAASEGAPEYELTASFTLRLGDPGLYRSARVARRPGVEGAARFEGFLFRLPGLALGDPSECVLNVPGPWFPQTYVAPDSPAASLGERGIGGHGAPDGGFGLLAISNTRLPKTLVTWMETGGAVGYSPWIQGHGGRVTFAFTDNREVLLRGGDAVDSDLQRVELTPELLPKALSGYRKLVERTMAPERGTPESTREMVILEVLPSYFKGGLKELTGRLPFYREVGFNTLYLMPHWLGGYSPIDLYTVDPKVGSAADLKALVERAHELGMKVLFDMVIHGFNEKSAVPKEHPELFIHEPDGSIARHPTWKSLSTDWASPAYTKYMVGLVLHDQREYDLDGYRVDAASYKGPNWDPKSPSPAYLSATNSPALISAMLKALRVRKPESVMLNEVFGPVFYTAANLSHDNQTEAPQQLLEMIEAGKATAADYKARLANVQAMLPKGTNRVRFARNHDTSWFYHFGGYTPRFLALDAIHALCGITEVFAGDPNNGPNPEDDPSTWEAYRRLFGLRKELPELARGDLLLTDVSCDNPMVFAAVRRLGDQRALIAISLSDKPQTAHLTLTGPAAPGPGQLPPLRDVLSTGTIPCTRDASGTLTLILKPFQVVAGRL
ncbi:MAG TPA: alpha-amylase family glycosyl hydrolase [Armatimonadota bacterium]|jgi:hypothetical protein